MAKKQASPAVDWVAVLRSGPAGVRKWNRLTDRERWRVKLRRADLSGCDLTGVKLHVLNGQQASFARASLVGARMYGCFANAVFAGADLRGAKMEGATFPKADFSGATLAGADLRSTGLIRTKFAAADLTGANLENASINKADLTAARLDGADLTDTEFDARTIWPAGFVLPAEAKWAGRGTDPRQKPVAPVKVQKPLPGMGDDFLAGLRAACDGAKLVKALSMLKAERFQLFAEVHPGHVTGVVRSQSSAKRVYACRLATDGRYSCCTQNLIQCVVSHGLPCKHLLVLVVGLVKAGQLDGATALTWLRLARKQGRTADGCKPDKELVTATFLRYKGAEAGEVDWRPTETIPEDFYAM